MIVYPWLSVSERHFDKASYTRGSGRVGCYKKKIIAFEFCVVTSLFSVHLSAGTDFDKSQAERVIRWTRGTPQNVFTGGNEWQLPKGLFVFFSSICWQKCQAPWLASILSIGMCGDDSSAGQFRGSGATYAETTEWVHGKKIWMQRQATNTKQGILHAHIFFLCGRLALFPKSSPRQECKAFNANRLFILWHLFLSSPFPFFPFLFFCEAQQLCRCRWAESSTPRCNNTIYFHINRLTNVSSLANHVSMATFPVAGRRRLLPVMRLCCVCGGGWYGRLTVEQMFLIGSLADGKRYTGHGREAGKGCWVNSPCVSLPLQHTFCFF